VAKLTDREVSALAHLAMMEGWAILSRHINEWAGTATSLLTRAEFRDLLEVGRLQGQITAYRKVIDFVNNRLKEAQKEG